MKLVTTLIANTKGDGKSGDDFWQKAETLLYTALIGYIHYEAPEEEQNFATLIEFINAMEVREDDETFENNVDLAFKELAQREPNHFAVRQYKKYKLAAGKTAKSINISCGARLAPFDIQELREITMYDELELDTLGDRKTALFLIMSDTDSTFNFLISMIYSQLFNLLCEKADDVYGGRLPVHVRCLIDECANIGQIPNLEKLMATIRSREISACLVLQAQSQLKALYGYVKDPENPKRWIVDEEAARVVRRIYRMTLEGVGTEQIAAKLEEDGVLTPRAYWHSKGINRPGKVKDLPPTHWNSSSVIKMLSVQEYCGDILNFKTYSKSYKNKKRLENDRENWAIFKDVHEPIIERAVFEQVQQKRGKMRKRQAKDGERSMFSGLLVCADCGSNLHFHFNQGNPEIKYFNCSNYKGNRGTCGSTHYVRVDFLEQVVLGEIRRLTKYAGLYEDDFLKEVIGHSRQAEETERRLKEKELKSLLARDDELDGLFERIYEDNVSGKLSDDRFAKMSRRYEEEQKELSEKIKKLRSEIEKQSSRATSTDMFVSIVRKYTRARKLTPRMLNELVEKIEVYNAEKIDGEWVQRLRIHYNCVGEMNIPNEPALPIPAVTVNTRKGVFVSYTTDDRPAV